MRKDIVKTTTKRINNDPGLCHRIRKDILSNKCFYIMVLPVFAFYLVFHYFPMYGTIIAFKDFSPAKGIFGSTWVGLKHFKTFFESFYFWRLVRNTILINVYSLLFGFPAPIILALLINELKSKLFSRTVQTITYIPHFISLVVVCGLIRDFTMDTGIFNYFIGLMGGEKVTLLNKAEYFRAIYVISDIWKEIGWRSIIYLAALASIDPMLYEAAKIDGAGRLRQTFHITLPGLMPIIVMLLILRIGQMMSVGFEKIILLYNPVTYETADVISTYVYRKGLQDFNWSFSSAVGLFNSVINFTLLIAANWISKKVNQLSLW